MTIPRLLHHIWVGPREEPSSAAWRDMHPGWEQRVWREADLDALKMRNGDKYRAAMEAQCWHGAADIARLEVLWQFGGVYVDIDSKPLRSLDHAPFMSADAFAAYEPVPSLPGRVANGTIGAKPGAHVIGTALSLLADMEVIDPPYDTVGAPLLTAAFLVHHRCCDSRVLPSRTFYPKDARGRTVAGREVAYCEHHWASTNGTYSPRAVVLVPRRGDGGHRDKAWAYVEEWWRSHGYEVFVGAGPDEGRFNAAAARNEAARSAGTWDVGIFADADTVPADIEVIRRAVAMAHERKRFVRPYKRYTQLDEERTAVVLEGGPLEGGKTLGENVPEGGIAIVPRILYDRVGGYDERFVGWGWEDTSFAQACRVMGGFVQLDGQVFHLWHPISSDRNTSDPQFLANRALGRRYKQTRTRERMRSLLSEREVSPQSGISTRLRVGLVVTANGRADHLETMMASVRQHVRPEPVVTLIEDDSGDPEMECWLSEMYPWARIDAHKHLGHGPAIALAWRNAQRLDVDAVLWMEEDMVWTRDIDLEEVWSVVLASGIKQMAFLRNSHFPAEVEAGPHQLSRFDPDLFTPETTHGHPWLRHREFYTLNPNLAPIGMLRGHRWPPRGNSEHHFSRTLFRHPDASVGMWGRLDDEPIVEHVGVGERTGDGY